jgi:putative glycosyltransferase
MQLSIVSTLYKSEIYLDEFLHTLIASIDALKIVDYEIIFVNDGSPDNSVQLLLHKKKEIKAIKIVDLSRNFGHHYAMQAGLSFAKGEFIFLIDNDLEVSPSILKTFHHELQSNDAIDVVYGFQEERKGSFTENFGGKIFWWGINKFSEISIPKNILTERLMRKEYVQNLLSLGDANLFLGGMMYWTGHQQKGISIAKKQRKEQSTYSTRKRLELMLQALTSFSGKPLEYLFYFGLIISFLAFVFIFYLIGIKILYNDAVQLGWTSIVAINVLILGVLSTFLGLIGIYLFKIFKQVQNRPNFIIKKIYE